MGDGLVAILDDVNDSIFDLLQVFDCVPIDNAWYKIINNGLCTEAYSGIYDLWIVLMICAFSLSVYFVMLPFSSNSSSMYQMKMKMTQKKQWNWNTIQTIRLSWRTMVMVSLPRLCSRKRQQYEDIQLNTIYSY